MSVLLSSCGHSNKGEAVSLPIKGHFSVKGDIIVEADKKSVLNDVIPNTQAFTYKDGEFYKLKRYETEITLPEEVTRYGKELNIPLQYFVCNKTVYAYPNVERKSLALAIEICSVPNDENRILITSGTLLKPVCVNLKSGKITPIFDKKKQDVEISGQVSCISEDGKYAAAIGTRIDEMIVKSYIINLKNFNIAEVPLPQYDKERYKYKNSYPYVFADGRLYINYTLTELDIDGGEKVCDFFYDVKKKKAEALAAPLTDYTRSEQYPYIQKRFDNETGTLKIKNLKEIVDYSFSVYPSNGLWGSTNKTGQYFIGSYFNIPLAGYDENGQPFYENVQPENQKYIVVDVKNQKRIDLSKIDDKFNYTTYDGKSCGYSWISETELLINCYDGEEEYIETVINVEGDSK